MPRTSQFTKDDIAAKAIELIREKGADALSARTLCAALGCSVSPLFTVFQNMEEISDYTRDKVRKLFSDYVADVTDYDPSFKEFGLRLVRFARNERNLFDYLFLQGSEGIPEKALECLESICNEFQMTKEQGNMMFQQLWALSCGLALLSSKEPESYTEEKVSEMLSIQFMSNLILIKSGKKVINIKPQKNEARNH